MYDIYHQTAVSHLDTDFTSLKPARTESLPGRLLLFPRLRMPLPMMLWLLECVGVELATDADALDLATLSIAVLSASITS